MSSSFTDTRTWTVVFYGFLVHFLGLMPAFQPTQWFQQCVSCVFGHCQVFDPLCPFHRSSSITYHRQQTPAFIRKFLQQPFRSLTMLFPDSNDGIWPQSLPEWAFRAWPGLGRNCLCPNIAPILGRNRIWPQSLPKWAFMA